MSPRLLPGDIVGFKQSVGVIRRKSKYKHGSKARYHIDWLSGKEQPPWVYARELMKLGEIQREVTCG